MEKVTCPICRGKGDIIRDAHTMRYWSELMTQCFVESDQTIDPLAKPWLIQVFKSNLKHLNNLVDMSREEVKGDGKTDRRTGVET